MSDNDTNPVATAWGLLTTNLVVLTGLGTYTGGRKVTGVLQMICGILGFVLMIGGLAPLVPDILAGERIDPSGPFFLTALAGVAVFLLGWFSSLVSGLLLVAEAKRKVGGAS